MHGTKGHQTIEGVRCGVTPCMSMAVYPACRLLSIAPDGMCGALCAPVSMP